MGKMMIIVLAFGKASNGVWSSDSGSNKNRIVPSEPSREVDA